MQDKKSFVESFNDFVRSSHGKCSIKKAVLKNFVKFTRKHLCQSLFFNKVVNFKLQPY